MTTIQARANSGRTFAITHHGIRDGLIHVSVTSESAHPYSICDDGYIHLIDADYTPEQIAAIKEINTYQFAERLSIESEIGEMVSILYNAGTMPMYSMIREHLRSCDITDWLGEVAAPDLETAQRFPIPWAELNTIKWRYADALAPLNSLHLGGTWQRYYEDSSWIHEAERIKGDTIYLTK